VLLKCSKLLGLQMCALLGFADVLEEHVAPVFSRVSRFILEDATDRLSRNVAKKLQSYAAYYPKKSADLIYTSMEI